MKEQPPSQATSIYLVLIGRTGTEHIPRILELEGTLELLSFYLYRLDCELLKVETSLGPGT